jgi:UDP-N-acetylmuramoyl-L-alanyl-D-glutamate--2,6-diaminopimelate ligase
LKQLKDILYKVHLVDVDGSTAISVKAIRLDSRKVEQGDLFVAVKGTQVDGHNFINTAIEKGAAAIVCSDLPAERNENVVYVQVKESSRALAQIASNFYDNPSEKLKLVAVTGTNGKTSVATILYNLYRALGYKTGLLSTVVNKIDDDVIEATHTTPDAVSLNELLAKMVEMGCDYCFMEASSHAIHQNRTYALDFDGAIFTNLTHDHLDYHETFRNYLNAKKQLFDFLPSKAFALVNTDDKNGKVMLQNSSAKKYTYALQGMADFNAKILENDFSGMVLKIDNLEMHTRMVGHFNAYNLLAVYGTAILLGADKMEVLTALSSLSGAEGRFEYIVSEKEKIVGVIDYAHTPDALKNVLETINQIRGGQNNIITVVGAGGNRDAAKRPLMAAIAAKLSNKVVLTSDNPRNEEPEAILAEMRSGIAVVDKKNVLSITQRDEAIRAAVSMANAGDVILVAGKGHEKYQEIKGIKHPFDDKEKLRNAFKEMEK